MPTVLRIGAYRFYFYSHEPNEPSHIHIDRDNLSAKFWLEPVPLVWYPRLLAATPEQREKWQVCGGGYGIHWEEIDEDLSTEGLLRGAPAPKSSFQG